MKIATTIENQVNRVSKKVYADLVSRVNNTLKATLRQPDIIPEAIQAIDEYIADGTIPTPKDGLILIVFYMIKSEIDRAAERSRRARERAAVRREKLQAAKSAALKSYTGLIPSAPKPVDDLKSAVNQLAQKSNVATKSPAPQYIPPQTGAIFDTYPKE